MTSADVILYVVYVDHFIINCCNVKDYFSTHYFIDFHNNNNTFMDIYYSLITTYTYASISKTQLYICTNIIIIITYNTETHIYLIILSF